MVSKNQFSKKYRLSGRDIKSFFSNSKRVKYPELIAYFKKSHLQFSRLGIIITRKAGSSVTRNSIKRAIRVAFRTRGCFRSGDYFDIIARVDSNSGVAAVKKEFMRFIGEL